MKIARHWLGIRLKYYLISTGFVWLMLAAYLYNPYYRDFLNPGVRPLMLVMAIGYSLYAFLSYLTASESRLNGFRGVVVAKAVGRWLGQSVSYLNHFPNRAAYKTPSLNQPEKVAIRFVLVKIFFIPLMLSFALGNYHSIAAILNDNRNLGSSAFSFTGFNFVVFPVAMSILFTLDTAIFAFGYLFEASWLRNKVRSVEPTVLGWAVALACYPPLNSMVSQYISSPANDYAQFGRESATTLLHICVLLAMFIFVLASIALGTKASNLTNRGIVSRGPYAVVRHPAYTAKNLAWWLTILPVFSLGAIVGMAFWSFIYFMRAITEERHLISDPDYQTYCRQVRYRFIPGLV